MIDGLCQRYNCLPYAGGLLDQPASLIFRMIKVLELGSGERSAAPPDPLANIPMMVN